MASNLVTITRRGFGETSRKDLWWVAPLLTFLGLGAFVVYSTWAAFQGNNYHYTGGGANYLSPFYSPELFGFGSRLVRAKTCRGSRRGFPFRPHFSSSGLRADSGSPVTTIAGRITKHSGRPARVCGRRAAAQLSRRAEVPARYCRTSTVSFCTSRSFSSFC